MLAKKSESEPMILLDMDGLKAINDQFGHLTGSRALVRLGKVLSNHSRAIDTPARYGGDEAQFRINPVGLLSGNLPPRILAMIVEWAAIHRDELLANWDLCQNNASPNYIEGLP